MSSAFYLLILSLSFTLISCTPHLERKSVPQESLKDPANQQKILEAYQPQMLNVRMLIWPLVINSENQSLVSSVIKGGRTLNELQNSYSENKELLKRSYDTHFCECALYDICTGEEPAPIPTQACEEIEKKIQTNEEKIQAISQTLESMKASLLKAKGSWLEPDPTEESLFLFKADISKLESGKWLLSDENSQKSFDSFSALDGVIKSSSNEIIGNLKLEASVQRSYLQFHGDIEMMIDNKKRTGILVFQQNPK